MEGSLENGSLVDALRDLGAQARTGILTVQGEEEIIAFSFLEGSIVSADALNQSLEDGLGEVLVREQLVGADDFAGLVAEYQAGGGRVTDLLLERAFMTRDQLLRALGMQTYELCRQALTWKKGEFRFYQGDDVAFEQGTEPLRVDELLVQASEDLGAAGPLGDFIPNPSRRYKALVADGVEGAVPAEVRDSEREEAEPLYRALTGDDTLARVAEQLDMPLVSVQAIAGPWLANGLVEEKVDELPPVELPDEFSAGGPVADLGLDAVLESPMEAEQEEESESLTVAAPVLPVDVSPWPPRLMGLALLAATLWTLAAFPDRLLFPFPWQSGLRTALEIERTSTSIAKIRGAATSFFLLEGRYPEDLSLLVADRMLPSRATQNVRGDTFVLSSGPASYLVQTASASEDNPSTWPGSISENFLLDPEFLVNDPTAEAPLVLLD